MGRRAGVSEPGPNGHAGCYHEVIMTVYLRYIGMVLAVLVLAVLFVACGDIACGNVVHPCCTRSDRADRLGTETGRVLASYALRGESSSAMTRWYTRTHPRIALATLTLRPPLALAVLPLRI